MERGVIKIENKSIGKWTVGIVFLYIGLCMLIISSFVVYGDLTDNVIAYYSFDNIETEQLCDVISESITICPFHISNLFWLEGYLDELFL